MIKIIYTGTNPDLKDFECEVPIELVGHGFVYSTAVSEIMNTLTKANICWDKDAFTTNNKGGHEFLNHWKVKFEK